MSAERSARTVSDAEGVDRVRALRRVLYCSAKQDPHRRFHALYDKVARSDVLWRAWAEVATNQGAPGVDGVSVTSIADGRRPGGASLPRRPGHPAAGQDVPPAAPAPGPLSCTGEAGALRSGRVVLSRPSSLLRAPPTPGSTRPLGRVHPQRALGRLPLPGVAGYRQDRFPGRSPGAEEGLSSSEDNLLAIPRPLRREVLRHPLQGLKCLPWPSPLAFDPPFGLTFERCPSAESAP